MFEEMLLPFFALFLGAMYENAEKKEKKFGLTSDTAWHRIGTGSGRFWFLVLAFALVCYSGLRTRMNDTPTYINSFVHVKSGLIQGIRSIDWSPGANPFFNIIQIFIRSVISSDGHVFVFLISLFTVGSYMKFLRRYATDFSLAMFVFVAYAGFSFTTSAMKQSLATSIAIWAIPAIIDKKYFKAVLCFCIAALVHPYVVVLAAAFFLKDNIWDKKTSAILIVTFASTIFYTQVADFLMSAAESVGDSYDLDTLTEGGVNILRVGEALVIPVLSFLYKDKLRSTSNSIVFISVNMSLLFACFNILALNGGSFLIGRIPMYFNIFVCLAFVYVARIGLRDTPNGKWIIFVVCASFLFFDYYGAKKYLDGYCGGDWFGCFYNHISFFDLLKAWFT